MRRAPAICSAMMGLFNKYPALPDALNLFWAQSKKMSNGPLRFFRIGVLPLLLAHSSLTWCDSVAKEVVIPAPARQAELLNLVRHDCGSCHGLRFEGGLGVPLTPAALYGKSPDALRDSILYGRNGTTMPPWSPFLTGAEAGWIVKMLMKGLP